MPEVFVAAGSNVDRESSVRKGLAHLRQSFGALQLSPVYESEPAGFSGDPFFNFVVTFVTDQIPQELVDKLRRIEYLCGRPADARKFEPRTLDLDLLLYGDEVIERDGLKLPRAEILRYGFVLKPLADLAPARRHPELGRTFGELWAEFSGEAAALKAVGIRL